MIEIMSLMLGSASLSRFVLFPYDMYGAQKAMIRKNFAFYNHLSESDKRIFEHRVIRFIESHNFSGREGVVITKKMEILVASTAVMLTFGMRRYLFPKFKNIIIYPKNYISNVTKRRHKGETNPRMGTIVFSWDNFMKTMEVEDNNLNLGLHELTHALHFNFIMNGSFTAAVFLDRFTDLLEKMKEKELQLKIVNSGYLRSYAYTNKFEFLSVLVEHFFETPEEFQEKLPEVYDMVKQMLNIDLLKMSA